MNKLAGSTAAQLLKAAEHGGPYRFIARVAFSGRHCMAFQALNLLPRFQTKKAEWKAKRAARKQRWQSWIYTNTSKQVGDPEHLKVFANQDAATNGSSSTMLKA